jgi:hypothetical protein
MSDEQQHEPREFEGVDLDGAVFWGVNLSGALFRDVDLTGARVFHAQLTDVDIDGIVERLLVNGVDVTDYVNAHDAWYPLRTQLRPADAAGILAAWDELDRRWAATCERAFLLGEAALHDSVNGEWSFRDTLRHLVFAFDKWLALPLFGDTELTACGLPNTGSAEFDWPGLDRSASPGVGEVLAIAAAQSERLRAYLAEVDLDALPAETEVLENGTVPTLECFYAVLEETFEHLRYAVRDLTVLEQRRA